jgi:carbon storage regulator CsrA
MVSIDRRVGQRVYLSDGCVITVLAIDAHSVRLNFIAPKDIKILREELIKRISPSRSEH